MTHCERVLDYIRRNGSISQREAYNSFGCTRLSGMIYDLKQRGYKFNVVNEVGQNRYGEPEHHARYWLKEEPEQLAV